MPSRGFDIEEFAEAYESGDVDDILSFYADDAMLVVPGVGRPAQGKDALRRAVASFRGAFEAYHGEVEHLVEGDRMIAYLARVTGRHTSDLEIVPDGPILPASGKEVDMTWAVFLDLDADGRILRETDIVDRLGVMERAGMVPPEMVPEAGEGPEPPRGAATPSRAR